MTPIQRSGAIFALALLIHGCGGSGGGDDRQSNRTVVTVTCTPAFIQKLGVTRCSGAVEGEPAEPNTIDWSANAGSIDSDGRFIAPPTAGSVTITANHRPTSGTGSLNIVISGARALADLPDDSPGHQVHVLYAVASDGEDREFDTNGTLALSVEAWNEWFAAKTGRRLRLDRSGGALDVSFVRLAHSNDALNDYGAGIRERIEFELIARGFDAPHKAYLVYYEGGDAETGACGRGAWPPTRPGQMAAVFLQAIPATGVPCNTHAFASDVNSPGFLEFTGLHEVLHVLGFAPSCAASHAGDGHVVDSPADILYAGTQAWVPEAVDVGGNDYLEAGVLNCIDLATSAFLDPLPAGQLAPPGWPYVNLAAQDCGLEPGLASTPGDPAQIQFINPNDHGIIVYRIDEDANRVFRAELGPYEGQLETTQTTHPYVVTSDNNLCLGIFFGTSNMGRAIAISP